MRTLVLFFSLCYSSCTLAQMSVFVAYSGKDLVGPRLIYAVKEKIRQSSSLRLSLDLNESVLQGRIVTIDWDTRKPGYATIYSLVITLGVPETQSQSSYFIQQSTGVCGTKRIQECAEDIVAEISTRPQI
ncbi:MAG TPA: hypothetical protein PKC23_08705 [Candidatus Desulfobacillus sp.]|nr:hypothetical protein [Candidatus Desulfobacillus sp.]